MNSLTTQERQPDAPAHHLSLPPTTGSALSRVIQSREATAVIAAIYSAKQFPRDEVLSLAAIKRSCQRPTLAAVAFYSYSRGGSTVSGPSIRLAEAVAAAWGNIDHGWQEIDRRQRADGSGVSTIQAYAVDLQTNYRKALVFDVPHWRDTKQGGYALTSERDIYELCANQASRRVRNCLLAIIPGDVAESAVEECNRTLDRTDKAKPLADRVRDMAAAYVTLGVAQAQIEARLGHPLAQTTEAEFKQLRSLFGAIRDGATSIKVEFPAGDAPATDPKPSTPPSNAQEPAGEQGEKMLASDRLHVLITDQGWEPAAAEAALKQLGHITNGLASISETKAQRIVTGWDAIKVKVAEIINQKGGE